MYSIVLLLASFLVSDLPATELSAPETSPAPQQAAAVRIRVTFSDSVSAGPITGRLLLALAPAGGRRSPINMTSETGAPLFGLNVTNWAPGTPITIDESVHGYPIASINDVPPGQYSVQAMVNVYTRCDRSDGHVVWVPLDRGEGQAWKRKPGNLRSKVTTITIDPAKNSTIDLVIDEKIAPISFPADTNQVKRFKIRSELLSKFWGQDIYLGATVLLPKGYDEHPDVHYPVNYSHGHFSSRAPGGFGRRGAFDKLWLADDTPRFLYVTIQHPSPYYDDSYAVNSANNGPYGDAIHEELIPEIEKRFRAIREPWARQLSGGSTGGWIALALQIFYPDFYGGCWASCPDSPDFRYHQIVDIYKDKNAYWLEHDFMKVDRPTRRRTDGNIAAMMKDENWFELAAGDKNRSGGQWDIWEATFSPVASDGYPRRLWNKRTGVIDHAVAKHWREHYDLRHILQRDWKTVGPKLAGKLHVFMGDMDSYYLNNGCYLLEQFLESTTEPHYGGTFEYARKRGHCWGPEQAKLMRLMTDHVKKTAPKGSDQTGWRY